MSNELYSVMDYLDDAMIEFDELNKVSKIIDQNGRSNLKDMVGKDMKELFPNECVEEIIGLWVKSVLYSKGIAGEINYTKDDTLRKYIIKIVPKNNRILMFVRKSKEDETINEIHPRITKGDKEIYYKNDTNYRELLRKISQLAGTEKNSEIFINKCIELVGKAMDLDCVYIVQYCDLQKNLLEISKWMKEGNNHKKFSHKLKEQEIKWLNKRFTLYGDMNFVNVSDIGCESIRNIFIQYAYKSVLAVPFYLDNYYKGFILFGQVRGKRKWLKSDINMIEALSIVVSQAIMKQSVQNELCKAKEEMEVTLLSIADGVIVTDKQGKIRMINKTAEQITGWKMDEAIGKKSNEVINIVDKKNKELIDNFVDIVLETKKIINWGEPNILITKDFKEKYIDSCSSPIINKENEVTGVVMVIWDMTGQVRKDEKIIYLSQYDAMTELYNRGYFEEVLKNIDSQENLPISIIMGDLNGLKMINDVFGHDIGDDLLRSIGRIIVESCRQGDLAARWGGDEFLILLINSSDEIASSMCRVIKQKCKAVDTAISEISISLGYATKKKHSEQIFDTIKRAENYMYQKKLLEGKSLRNSIIVTMQKTLSEKSHETEEHAKRLEFISRKIGENMNLSSDKLDELQLLAMLHDIGKISIRDDILLKPDKLTEVEWREMKKHCHTGYQILKSVPELSHIANYVLYHHERWDGKGYPQGLSKDNIPLLSRIISVADAYDAMVNDRVYRKALTVEVAKTEIKNNAGRQFDPEIVNIFLTKVIDQI
ncbi:MAG: diguanylate cyclase [Maledivibacter sp.]|jgi:diguanylate cyclase (GGDEF)-like protein/PAS domain S-box-containing protein|nr:diguanylate cyclase [Maledivibacter sp.]